MFVVRPFTASLALVLALAWGGAAGAQSPTPPPAVSAAAALGLPTAAPESEGFSPSGLRALRARFRGLVDDRKLAGVTTVLSRHGRVVHSDTYGRANAATGEPLRPDSIFRIASMTKPITGVAMMQLYEQGKWKLDDPVSRYIPQFAELEVRVPGGGTEPQRAPMTMAQLMSHSAGFGVSPSYAEADLSETDLQGMIDKLAELPLATQPGTAWDYGPSVNIQGYLVEKLSGQPLDVYFSEHIFEPLGMVDTGFFVPEEKASRLVAIHGYDAAGEIEAEPEQRVPTRKPAFLSGSGGLLSTARDYWRFAQALANGGELEGQRILRSETVVRMRQNVLEPGVEVDLYGSGIDGLGFGLDFAVVLDPEAAGVPQGVNSYYWGGAFGTWFWIDPTHDIVFVGMIQNRNGSRPTGGTPPVRQISSVATYEALGDPE